MLSARAVRLQRAGFRLDVDEFSTPAESLHALVGPNGAGKTTWLQVLCGRLSPQAGEVSAFGGPPGPPEVLYLPARPENTLLGADRRMEVEAGLALLGRPRREAPEQLRRAEAVLDLPPERGEGQAERVYRALLGLVAEGPRVLLLDEPTARAGPDAAIWIVRSLLRLRDAGCALVVATHDPEVVRAADRVSVVRDGTVRPSSLGEAVSTGVLRPPELGRALLAAGWGERFLPVGVTDAVREALRG